MIDTHGIPPALIGFGVIGLIIGLYYWRRMKGLSAPEKKMQIGVFQGIGAAGLYFWIKEEHLTGLGAILVGGGVGILAILAIGNFVIGVLNVAAKGKKE